MDDWTKDTVDVCREVKPRPWWSLLRQPRFVDVVYARKYDNGTLSFYRNGQLTQQLCNVTPVTWLVVYGRVEERAVQLPASP